MLDIHKGEGKGGASRLRRHDSTALGHRCGTHDPYAICWMMPSFIFIDLMALLRASACMMHA